MEKSAYIKTANAIGPAVWFNDKTSYNCNGTVVNNTIQGALWATGTTKSGSKLLFNPIAPYLQVYNSTNAVIWHS